MARRAPRIGRRVYLRFKDMTAVALRGQEKIFDAPERPYQARLMRYLIVALILIGTPLNASANIGLPMIAIVYPWMLIALLPVIALETFVFIKYLHADFSLAFPASTVANAVSTIIGIPVSWIGLVVIQFISGGVSQVGADSLAKKVMVVIWQAPWLIIFDDPNSQWMVHAATFALLIPFFFASWWIEYHIVVRFLKNSTEQAVKRTAFYANLSSYSLLAIIILCRMITGGSLWLL